MGRSIHHATGLIHNSPSAEKGYTLFSSQGGKHATLIDMDGQVVHRWNHDEGIVYADIDLNKCIQPKQMHDILGNYNRFDIFDLRVNKSKIRPISLQSDEQENEK